jgi:hypothetical protein
MVDACGSDLEIVSCLRENERALEGGLSVEREALGGPVREHVPLAHGFFDVWNQRRSMLADTAIAGVADGRVRVVDLLHHGAGEAGEVGQLTHEQGLAEIDIGQQAVERISDCVIRCGGKERTRAFAPVAGCGQRQLFLAIEVVEEASLGQAGGFADVLDARGGISFGADYVQGRVEDPGLRFVSYFRRSQWKPTNRYGAYLPVGGLSKYFIASYKTFWINDL